MEYTGTFIENPPVFLAYKETPVYVGLVIPNQHIVLLQQMHTNHFPSKLLDHPNTSCLTSS